MFQPTLRLIVSTVVFLACVVVCVWSLSNLRSWSVVVFSAAAAVGFTAHFTIAATPQENMAKAHISASKTQQSQPVREVFPYINFCVVPQSSSKKRGYWQLQQGYSTVQYPCFVRLFNSRLSTAGVYRPRLKLHHQLVLYLSS